VDTSWGQGQCSIVEPERDLCFSTLLACALPPEGAAMPFAAAITLNSNSSMYAPRALRKLEPIRGDGRRGSAGF
jgi:hypothetical protein